MKLGLKSLILVFFVINCLQTKIADVDLLPKLKLSSSVEVGVKITCCPLKIKPYIKFKLFSFNRVADPLTVLQKQAITKDIELLSVTEEELEKGLEVKYEILNDKTLVRIIGDEKKENEVEEKKEIVSLLKKE